MRFYRFLKEVLRFNKESKKYLLEYESKPELTLDERLIKKEYSEYFKNWCLLPLGGCIWSSPIDEMLNFPAYTFLPPVNKFTYSGFYIRFSIEKLKDLESLLFSVNKFNLFSFYEKDHGYRDGSSLEKWANDILA